LHFGFWTLVPAPWVLALAWSSEFNQAKQSKIKVQRPKILFVTEHCLEQLPIPLRSTIHNSQFRNREYGGEQEKQPCSLFSAAHLLVQDREKGNDPVDEGDLLKGAIGSGFQFKIKSAARLPQVESEQ
jgi:hypothetical protein